MTFSPALVELFRFLDDLHERVERTWWGAVATDSRFPGLWESNYAAVDAGDPALSLQEVRAALHPALREAGATHEHIWIMQPSATGRLLGDLDAEGQSLGWDDLMFHGPETPLAAPAHPVEEVFELDDTFWDRERSSLREFGITESDVLEQMVRRQHDVLWPAGKRWFAVRDGDQVAGVGSMLVHGGAAFLDDVMTFPAFRRRGMASSVVSAMVGEARAAGANETYLFADQPGPLRLYQGLRFEVLGRVMTSLAPLSDVAEAQRPAAPSAPCAPSRSGAAPVSGRGPGRPRK